LTARMLVEGALRPEVPPESGCEAGRLKEEEHDRHSDEEGIEGDRSCLPGDTGGLPDRCLLVDVVPYTDTGRVDTVPGSAPPALRAPSGTGQSADDPVKAAPRKRLLR